MGTRQSVSPSPRAITSMRPYLALAMLVAVVAASGCGSQQESTDSTQEPSVPSSTTSSTPSEQPTGPGAVAAADLAKRLGIDAADVSVVMVESVTWRDGSLGCPEPGKMYTQALVEGHRIELEAGGQTYAYHSGGRRAPFLCENPQPPAP